MLQLSEMKNTQTAKNKKKIIITMTAFAALFILGAIGYLLITPKKTEQASTKSYSFTFDTAASPGWWAPGGYTTTQADIDNPDRIDTEPLPIASINAFQGEQGKTSGGCFVMAFSQKGTIDIAAQIKDRKEALILGQENTASVNAAGEAPLTLETPEGSKKYTLYQYDLNLGENAQVQRGNGFGFIQLNDIYVEVRAICPTADMLASTHVGLSAIRLNP